MNVSKVIAGIPSMSLRDTVNLWRNAIQIVEDAERNKLHRPAQQTLKAIEKEWIKRRKQSVSSNEWFQWPSVEATGGSGQLRTDDWTQEGVLQYMGYRVGNTDGEPTGIRHQILSRAFQGPIPPAFPPDYLSEWGGLPTFYQGAFCAVMDALKVVPVLSIAQATLRSRSATDRSARP